MLGIIGLIATFNLGNMCLGVANAIRLRIKKVKIKREHKQNMKEATEEYRIKKAEVLNRFGMADDKDGRLSKTRDQSQSAL